MSTRYSPPPIDDDPYETGVGFVPLPDETDPYEAPNLSEDQFFPEGEGFWSENTGRMGLATAGAIKGYNKTPGPPWLKTAGAVIGAGVGGFLGEGTSQTVKYVNNSRFAPKNFAEALDKSFQAGGEEAVYELAGGALFKVGQWGWRWYKTPGGDVIRHQIDEAQEMISSQVATRNYPEYGIKIGDTIPGNLTVSQRTQSRFLDTIESMIEMSWGGGRVGRQLGINQIAVKEYTEKYLTTFDGTVSKLMTDQGMGTLFLNSVELGKRAHSTIGGKLFKDLDDMYVPLMRKVLVEKEVATGVMDISGKMLSKKTTQLVEKEVLPVSSSELKRIANEIEALTDPTKGVTLGDWGGNLIKKIKGFDDTMSFAAAQEFRSGMLAEARAATKGMKLGEGKAPMIIRKLAKAIDDAIEVGAKKTGNKEFYEQYGKANQFWRTGKENLSNDFMAKLLSMDASAIGKTIFNGTPEGVYAARKALVMAARTAKKSGVKFSSNDIWLKMQQGYMDDIISNFGKVSDTGKVLTPNLDGWLTRGTDMNKSVLAAFNKNQIRSLNSFNEVMKIAQKRPMGDATFLVKIAQGGLIIGAPAALAGNAIGAASAAWAFGSVTILPNVLSRLLVNPRWSKLLTNVVSLSSRPGTGERVTAAMIRLMAAVGDIEMDLGIDSRTKYAQ